MRPRISLSRSMTVIAAVALGLALVVAVVKLEPGPVVALTVAFLGLGTLGVPLRGGRVRAFCLGFGICGWSYFAAAFWSPEGRLALPTSRPLVELGERVFHLAPAVKGPEDLLPLIRWLQRYLSVAQSVVALAVGLVGGLLAVSLALLGSRLGAFASEAPLELVSRDGLA